MYVCEKEYFLVLFCIMQQVTLDDGAVKMWGGGVIVTLWSWFGNSN